MISRAAREKTTWHSSLARQPVSSHASKTQPPSLFSPATKAWQRVRDGTNHFSIRAELTQELHVYPDFHGNRSPRANPTLRGMLSGLKLSAGVDDLALIYLATIQAIAYGLRHILEEMDAKGYAISKIFACGGGLKNDVFLREHANITGCELLLPREPEAVLLGAAILGAVASGVYPNILEAMKSMNAADKRIEP